MALPASAQSTKDLFCRGKYELRDGRYGEAIVSFSHAIRSNPRLSEAYFYRGTAHHYNKRYPEAIANYNQALALGTRSPGKILANRAAALAQFGDYKQALEDVKLALQHDPDDEYLRQGLAFAFLKLGSRKSAIAVLEKMADEYFRNGRGSRYLRMRDLAVKVRAGGSFPYSWQINSWVTEQICP